jgi:hypothetical protein
VARRQTKVGNAKAPNPSAQKFRAIPAALSELVYRQPWKKSAFINFSDKPEES